MRQKTKNHQNQESIDKKIDFLAQSPRYLPRWVYLVQKTRASEFHLSHVILSIYLLGNSTTNFLPFCIIFYLQKYNFFLDVSPSAKFT